jgi:hypothetical protein
MIMGYALTDDGNQRAIDNLAADPDACEVVPFRSEYFERESLSENFINELEAWARHALAANGFGDY